MPDPGKQDADCKLDYIEIAGINQDLKYTPETIVWFIFCLIGSSGTCVQGSQNANGLVNKFCGNFLTAQKDGKANIAVCGKNSLQIA